MNAADDHPAAFRAFVELVHDLELNLLRAEQRALRAELALAMWQRYWVWTD